MLYHLLICWVKVLLAVDFWRQKILFFKECLEAELFKYAVVFEFFGGKK